MDPGLEQLYGVIYLEGTGQVHANSLGMERRLAETESGYRYKGISEAEAAVALHFAHDLMLRLLNMQNEYFNLNLDETIQERAAAFKEVGVRLHGRQLIDPMSPAKLASGKSFPRRSS
jgi:hypothetical protein